MRLAFRLWHEKSGKEWIAVPAREWVDKQGKRQFANLIELDRPMLNRFQRTPLETAHRLTEKRP